MDLTKSYTSRHSAKALFQAWISPEMIIPPATKIEVKPEVGGYYVLYAQSEIGEFIMRGEFIEIVNYEKLKYTWHWEGTEETTSVIVEFIFHKGITNIEIHHTGFLTEKSRENHSSGWDDYVKELEQRLSH